MREQALARVSALGLVLTVAPTRSLHAGLFYGGLLPEKGLRRKNSNAKLVGFGRIVGAKCADKPHRALQMQSTNWLNRIEMSFSGATKQL